MEIGNKTRQTVLVVDDQPENLLIVSDILGDEYAVETAASGEAALHRTMLEPRPDLLLLDLRMPGLDGYDVIRRLKADAALRDIPVIIVTARDQEADEERGLAEGAVDYVTKPVRPNILRARVRTHLALSSARRELQLANTDLERRVAERTASLERAMQAAEAASRAKSDFLSTVGHELRTPLNGIIGASDLLMDTNFDAEQLEYVRLQRTSASTLQSALADILDYATLDEFRDLPEAQEFSPRVLLDELKLQFTRPACQKNLEILCKLAENLPATAIGDETRIRKILLKLIDNAIKFTQQGTLTLTLQEVAEPRQSPRLRFEVRDTGIGIERAVQGRLFQPFVQADTSVTRRHGGSGLGLAIARKLTDILNGSLGFDSEPGVGSVFWLEVPIRTHG